MYTKEELESAKKALSSSQRKIEKVRLTLEQKPAPPKAQLTLAARNLAALQIALELIERQLESMQ